MRTFLFACSFVILSSTALASDNSCINCSFTGIVVDAATGKPMANVVIIAKGIALCWEQKVITDEQGQYKIPSLPSGTYTLRFEKDNYKPLEKRNLSVKKNPATLNIKLLLEQYQGDDHHNWLLKI